jgi:hypothetical protein
LILHRIGVDECLRRQHCNYHKCHRCVYRGQSANWTPLDHAHGDETAMTTGARGVPSRNGVARRPKAVELPSTPPASAQPAAKPPAQKPGVKAPKLPKAEKKEAPPPARTPTPPSTSSP